MKTTLSILLHICFFLFLAGNCAYAAQGLAYQQNEIAQEKVSPKQNAPQIPDKIIEHDTTQARELNLKTILFEVIFTLLSTFVLVLLLVVLRKLSRRLCDKIQSWKETRIPDVKIQRLKLVSSGSLTVFMCRIVQIVHFAIVIALVFFYTPLVLSFFPVTERLSGILFGHIITPLRTIGESFVNYLPKLIYIFVVVVLTHFILKFIKFIFQGMHRKAISIPGFYPEWANTTYKLVRFVIFVAAAIFIFPNLPGSDSAIFKGMSLFVGIVISLGSTSAVSNIIAGIIITYMRAFKIGDRVRISDTVGDVVEKTLLVTRIKTIKNVEISIPNSLVLGSHVINYSHVAKKPGLILHTSVTIGYGVPWPKVHDLLINAAKATDDILVEPDPFVLQISLDDWYVRYELNAYTDNPHLMANIYSELHKNIQDRFREAGVEIMSPRYSAVRDGNLTTIPEDRALKSESRAQLQNSADDTSHKGRK